MNAQQARKIDMPDLLSRMGYQPYGPPKKGGRELWYLSPLPGRHETVPSFHITYINGKWLWKDFGADKGGNVIDFVIEHQGTDFKRAMRFLKQAFQSDLFEKTPSNNQSSPFSYQTHIEQKAEEDLSSLEFLKAFPVQHPAIFQYLEGRGLSKGLIKRHLLEIRYLNKIKNKVFFGFGMKNQSNGYEIRSASHAYSFKSALIKRDVTLLEGSQNKTSRVHIFEGMLDALSLLALRKQIRPAHDYLIMHSTNSYSKATQLIRANRYEEIHTFLDNDPTGEKALQRFQKDFEDQVFPQNENYRGYNDLNDYLVAEHQQEADSTPGPINRLEIA